MSMKDVFLAQFERESAGTRNALAAVPEGKNDWRPHPKSMPLGSLAALVASMPSWVPMIVEQTELDLSKGGGQQAVATNRELLQIHDQSMDAARKSLSKATDEQLMKSWRLLFGEKVLDDRPRHLMIADTISHLAHHRGQLTVYLRLNDKPVPAIYGATADQTW
jgi:uncharacterized damage-inducible protein DinB